MATIRGGAERADEDFRDKLILENEFMRSLTRSNNKLVRTSARTLLESGSPVDVESEQGVKFPLMLLLYYQRVVRQFKNKTGIAKTDREKQQIETALKIFTDERAPIQAKFIMETSQLNSDRAMLMMDTRRQVAAEEGEVWSEREATLVFASIFSRKLNGRRSIIATNETNAVAEASKLTEVEVLLGIDPFVVDGATKKIDAVKEWVSQGDSIVRTAHIIADSIQVRVDRPFIVKGQRLMFPGDTSLGATQDNVAGCRCTAVYDLESVASSRQDLRG